MASVNSNLDRLNTYIVSSVIAENLGLILGLLLGLTTALWCVCR